MFKCILPAKIFFFILCLLYPGWGCKKIAQEIKLTREQMIFGIDEAVTAIQNAPSVWQTTLSDLEEEFVDDLNTNIAARVSILKNEIVGQVSTGIICLMDAAANRAVFGLRRLKAELLGDELPLPTPHLCSTSHYTIDLSRDVTLRREVIFYGFDFVQREKFSAYLVKNGGGETYMANSLRFLTNYQFVVNLAPYNDNIIKQFDYLSIRFEGAEISTLAIQKNNLPLATRTITQTPGDFGFIPPHTKGNNSYDGSLPMVGVATQILRDHKQVFLKVYMSARQPGGDQTTAQGWSNKHIFYTAPNGWHIKHIEGPAYFQILNNWTGKNEVEQNLPLTLGQWTLFGCDKGGVPGSTTRLRVNFNYPVTIIIEADR